MEKTREINVTAYPYAVQWGTINVPENITDEDEIKDYISEHWEEISFGEPDLDYVGTDFNIYSDDLETNNDYDY